MSWLYLLTTALGFLSLIKFFVSDVLQPQLLNLSISSH